MRPVHDEQAANLLTTALSCALLTSTLWLHGCNVVAPAVAVAAGPPKTAARHLLANVPTVVFVDDRMSRLDPASLRRAIADKVNQELMANEILTTTISPQDAMLIASRSDRASEIMAIEDIGKAVGAQQVIYVEIAQFKNTPDGYTPRPFAMANVKVLDVAARHRVFPEGGGKGWPVQVTGAPIAHIIEQAAKYEADYIVMGSHGHTAIYDLLVGSTTHGVLMRARCPVVIVPATKPALQPAKLRRRTANV